ncbi:MAG: hypothetical protein Q8K97_12415 [Pseudohongiella sp.]|nr:hypothetical protein [Pseudohongiella sp.]
MPRIQRLLCWLQRRQLVAQFRVLSSAAGLLWRRMTKVQTQLDALPTTDSRGLAIAPP